MWPTPEQTEHGMASSETSHEQPYFAAAREMGNGRGVSATRHRGPARAGSRARRTMRGGRGGGQSRGRWRAQGSAGGQPTKDRLRSAQATSALATGATPATGDVAQDNGVVRGADGLLWHASADKRRRLFLPTADFRQLALVRGKGARAGLGSSSTRPPLAQQSRAAHAACVCCSRGRCGGAGALGGGRKGRTSACCELPAQAKNAGSPLPLLCPLRSPASPREAAGAAA